MVPDSSQDEDPRKSAMANFASGLLAAEEEDKKAKKAIIREGVERLEKSESALIKSSKMLTSELARIREEADMSPFVGTSGKITSPKLRRGEFIELLGRELLWIGREELKDKGGIISLSQLRSYFTTNRDNWELRDKDIPEALRWLNEEDMIPELDRLDDELTLIRFRPIELSQDTRAILKAAMGLEVTKSRLLSILGWQELRLDEALHQLEEDGIAIISGEDVYFPGL